MPLFFLLSGYVFSGLQYPFSEFLKRLASRIGLPYFIWAVTLISIKSVTNGIVNHPVSSGDYFKLLYDPVSPFWFLYALFFIQLAARVLAGKLGDWEFLLLSLFAFGLHFITKGGGEAIQGVLEFMAFFALGRLLSANNAFRGISPSIGWLAFGSMGIIECLCLWGGIQYMSIVGRLAGFALAILALAAFSAGSSNPVFGFDWVQFIGKNTLPIYCMHVIFTGFSRVLLVRLGITSLALHLLGGTLAGIVIPLLIYVAAQKMQVAQWLGFPLIRRKRNLLPQLVSE
jgi:fucose 4-O-acetylase-like acetyltransferase